MNDSELLELAANAARLKEHGWMGGTYCHVVDNTWETFDPLNDDGDALRLAVKLQLDINPYPKTGEVAAVKWGNSDVKHKCFVRAWDDPYAATRRAIVRAAAEIGRVME